MAGGSRTNPDNRRPYHQNRTSTETWARLRDLPDQTACVLAALTLGAIWKTKFAGGWVEHPDLVALGTQIGGDEDYVAKIVRRARDAVSDRGIPVRIEWRRARRGSRLR